MSTPSHDRPAPAGSGGAQHSAPVDWIVRAACQKHPGMDWEMAHALAVAAWQQMEEHGDDAPEVARRILAQNPGADASATAVVAAAAAEYGHAARSGSPAA